jgi:hypothetical protein
MTGFLNITHQPVFIYKNILEAGLCLYLQIKMPIQLGPTDGTSPYPQPPEPTHGRLNKPDSTYAILHCSIHLYCEDMTFSNTFSTYVQLT